MRHPMLTSSRATGRRMTGLFKRLLAGLIPSLLGSLIAIPAQAAGCDDTPFTSAVADSAWVNIDLTPAAGTRGVRDALRRAQQDHPSQPVRIRLAPGTYADNLGSEIFAQALWRSAQAPLWLVATDTRPDATVLGHGLNLLGVSYVAIDGLTIGPAQVGAWDGRRHADPQPLQAAAGVHVSGAALNARAAGFSGTSWNPAVYGQWQPSHHVRVQRVTVQNLFGRDERDGESSDSISMDGLKFNQVQDLWVLDSRVSQTTRHGIDNVGVHRAAFCRNVVSGSGGGLGIEAKGGSVDILFDSNLFHRVRRVELGGEDTDATYYFSADGRWDYEALRVVARNNLIVDPREAALEFSGCQDCAALNNTIYFSPGYQPPRDGDSVYGGDVIRVHDSRILGAADGAGSDCPWWDSTAQDYVSVDPCWQLGSYAPAPVNRVLRSRGLVVAHNLIVAHEPLLGTGGGAVMPCPLNIVGGDTRPVLDGNLWWNGGQRLPVEGCSALNEGAASALATALPVVGGHIDRSRLDRLISSTLDALQPVADGRLRSLPVSTLAAPPALDHQRSPRTAGSLARVGALAAASPAQAQADRVFNWAERFHASLFGSPQASQALAGYHARHYAATQTYVGLRDGRLYVLGPAFGSQPLDIGPLADWLNLAREGGF